MTSFELDSFCVKKEFTPIGTVKHRKDEQIYHIQREDTSTDSYGEGILIFILEQAGKFYIGDQSDFDILERDPDHCRAGHETLCLPNPWSTGAIREGKNESLGF